MKYCFTLLLFSFFLSACGDLGDEVIEGMTSDDAKTGTAILLEGVKEGIAADNTDPNLTPAPAAFNTAEICTYFDAATLGGIAGCLDPAEGINDDASGAKMSDKYKYNRYGSCSVVCRSDQGIPMGMAQLTIIYNGRDGGALADYEQEQYHAAESLSGADGVYYPKNGDIVIAVKGNYRVKFNAFADGKMKPEEVGKTKINAVLASIVAKLP